MIIILFYKTVTGLLRRADAEEAVAKYQIGVIPVGSTNNFGKKVISSSKQETEPMLIAESAMAIINHKTKPVDVMEICMAEDDTLVRGNIFWG